ncbi:MAG: NAD(P)-dependent glycerol-3-phosphate dehydrogenase [Planctomycetes bacterium]|nr:NAD(P)-dependent glycerol-3-phosphate dehydrogenase [Planctomycetota bacterium]
MSEIPKESVAVLGAGGWGLALSSLLLTHSHRVRIWGRDPAHVLQMQRERRNRSALPGYEFEPGLEVTSDPEAAVAGASWVIVTIPAQFVRATLSPFKGLLAPSVPVVTGTKGLEIGTLLRPTEVLRDALGPHPYAILSGPSHAEEITAGLPASVTAAAPEPALANAVRDLFASPRIRVYTSDDLVGVEFAGALKNVMAIAAGVCDGLALGDNAKAALVTRALAEMSRFGVARGAKLETFSGLAGIGDLMTTCYSKHGRNRAVGERLGRGEAPAAILGGSSQIAEGVWTAKALHDAGAATPAAMPIAAEVYAILYEGKPPRASVADLMSRPPRN